MIQYLFMDNLFKKYLEFKLQDIKWGEIKVNFKNSYEKIFKAKEGDLSSNIFIKDNSLFTDLLFRGELGFAESYINNKWETSNLTNLLKILLKNQQIKKKNWADNYFSKFIEKIKFILKSNSLNQAKKNIHYHYDLGNKFYSLWLDSSMTYSSGIFLKDNDNLLTSQNNKYDNIIKKLDIQSSDVILEVGSGWGGFIKRNYEITGSQIEGLTISEQQFSYVNELIKKNKLNIFMCNSCLININTTPYHCDECNKEIGYNDYLYYDKEYKYKITEIYYHKIKSHGYSVDKKLIDLI